MTPEPQQPTSDLLTRLQRIEEMLAELIDRQQVKEWYTTAEVAKLLGKSEFTVREWCRLGRIHATKKHSGRGAHPGWTVSKVEVERIQREGLLRLNHDFSRRH